MKATTTRCPLPAATAAVAEAAGRMNRYPDMAAVELRERLARHLGVTAGEVAVGPGSVGVLQQIITGLCDAGDEVISRGIPSRRTPSWWSWRAPARSGSRWDDAEGHDLDAMAAAVTGRTTPSALPMQVEPTSEISMGFG